MIMKVSVITLPICVGLTALVCAQGPLVPPTTGGGAVGPNPPLVGGNPEASMKTLHEVEPSTSINAENTPGDGTHTYVISSPGAYHLTENLVSTGISGIQITAAGVTLDLRGFEIGSSQGGTSGVLIGNDADRCSIKNGSISGFNFGVNRTLDESDEAQGGSFTNLAVTGHSMIALLGGKGWTVNQCRVQGGGNSGIVVGTGSTVVDSAVRDMDASAGTNGIQAREGSVIRSCAVSNCDVIFGIRGGEGSSIESCTTSGNTSTATDVETTAGIFADSRCIVSRCVSSLNSHSSDDNLNGVGIRADFSCLVIDCEANKNDGDGFVIAQWTVVRGCKSHFNGQGGEGAGFHVVDILDGAEGFNELSGNSSTFNKVGYDVDNSKNFIVKNSASGHGGNNYVAIPGNKVGVVVVPPDSGILNGLGTNASGVGTTNPWANFSF